MPKIRQHSQGSIFSKIFFSSITLLVIAVIGTYAYTSFHKQKLAVLMPTQNTMSEPANVLGANDSAENSPTKIIVNAAPADQTPNGTTSPSATPTSTPTPTPTADAVTDASDQVFYGRGTANNKVGMYVHNISDDIKAAAKLVNSNGGDWGYVLLTMSINDRNQKSWQGMFDAAASAHLIPIIQISNDSVCKPDKMDFDALASTLNSVKWPSKHRYIALFNEMNAKDYWCQRIAPDEYAQALDKAIKSFKAKSKDFFIMPGAFNSSARTQDRYMSEDTYLIKMNDAVPGIFKKIDGWSTHSYPQPNFSGDINNLPFGYTARDTINNYAWEMNLLKANFSLSALPIFITETGWLHKEGQTSCSQYVQAGLLSADTTSDRFKDAYTNYWLNDPRIVAITPFIFRSSDPCAMGFAWQKSDGSWYPQAKMLLAIPKTKGVAN